MRWYSSIHMSVNIHVLSDSCFFLFSVVQVTFLRLLLSDVFQSCIVVAISVWSHVFHRTQLFNAMHKHMHVAMAGWTTN